MPSAAQIEGERILATLLPGGIARPNINISSIGIAGGGRGIRYSIWPTSGGAINGEYRTTIIVPNASGPRRDVLLAQLRQHVDRHVQKIEMDRLIEEEQLACDVDEEHDIEIDDDMPQRAWRINCPLVLRHALDEAGLDHAARVELFEACSETLFDGISIAINDIDQNDPTLFGLERPAPYRWVRRATIRAKGVVWSQGMTRSYLKLDHALPQTLAAAAVGKPPSAIINLPGLDAPGLIVTRFRDMTISGQEFEINRAFTTLAPLPGETK